MPQAEAPAAITRSLKVDLFAPDELRRRVVGSVREYRAALRHAYGLLAEARSAGSRVEWKGDDCRVVPDTNNARVVAALAHGQASAVRVDVPADERKRGDGDLYHVRIGRGPVYELRAELIRVLPTALTFVIDSARRDIQAAWTAGDPEFPAATRGWLTLQGGRGIAQFNRRGIGMPPSTAKPRLDGRSLVLKWDREIGEVAFHVGKLDGGRWRTWQAVRDGDWKLGTVYLSEADGKTFATMSYQRPATACGLEPNRTAVVAIRADDPDTLMAVTGPDGEDTGVIDAADVRAFLAYQFRKRADLEARRGACGSPRRPWGFGKGWHVAQDTLARATRDRDRGVTDRNHAWSRRIVDWAVSWRCGVIRVGPLPARSFNGGPAVGCVGGHPWNWTEFKAHLRYKAEDVGAAVVFEDE